MGWNAINDTANRRTNLAGINTAATKLAAYSTKIEPVVAQLAAAEGVINHLVDIGVCTSHLLLNQFEMVDENFKMLKQDVSEAKAAVNLLSEIYSLPRNQRPNPKRSGFDISCIAKLQASNVKSGWKIVTNFKNNDFCENLEALAKSSPEVQQEEKATLTTLASTLRSLA
ncbi:MAG: hypothetical protein QE278_13305 [Limnobacter sp.]|nr:hypothetical protein [Limnobacter sp.]